MINTRMVELAAGLIVLLCVLDGLHRGLLMKVFSFVRLVVILLLTVLLMPIILPLIAEENLARVGGAYLLALVVSGLVVFLAARLLKLIDRIPVVKQINRLGGAVFGFCIGVVLVFSALTVIDAFQNVPWCCEVSACARQSEILRPLISSIPNMINN